MNFFNVQTIDLSMRTGCGPLSGAEASKYADHLTARMARAWPEDQLASRRLIRGLRDVPAPEAQYGDMYAPAGYVPGWQA